MDILIVVDMQNDFVKGALKTDKALSIVGGLKKFINEFKGKIIYTLDTHDSNYLESQEGKNLPIKHCVKGTWGHEIIEEFKSLENFKEQVTFEKNTFGSKKLVEYLCKLNQEEEIENIFFTGVCTDICVISNALTIKTFLPEVKLSCYKDYCAGLNEKKHQAALEVMDSCQIKVI